jgi:hypothetical protein
VRAVLGPDLSCTTCNVHAGSLTLLLLGMAVSLEWWLHMSNNTKYRATCHQARFHALPRLTNMLVAPAPGRANEQVLDHICTGLQYAP